MTTHLVTFSDSQMSRARELCVLSARHHGVKIVYEYDRKGVASAFVGYEAIWNNPKGCGLWAWKPMVISATLNKIGLARTAFNVRNPNDYLIYSDAGIEFVNNVNYIIDRMDQDIFLFGNNYEHAHWCKRDIVDVVWPDDVYLSPNLTEHYRNEVIWRRYGKQCQASVIFFRVSDYSKQFVSEWLKWCLFEGGRLIDDSPSRAPNHPEFRENRHDQAILTTLAYREGVRLHYWPASYNDGAFTYEKLPEYTGDDYPIMFNHHRKRNHEWANAE